MNNRITEKLNAIFADVAPRLPDDEGESIGDSFLQNDPELWEMVQDARERQAQQDAYERELTEIRDAVGEAAELAGLSRTEVRERLSRTREENARIARAYEDDERFSRARAEGRLVQPTAGEQHIARLEEQARQAEVNGDTANARVLWAQAEQVKISVARAASDRDSIETAVAERMTAEATRKAAVEAAHYAELGRLPTSGATHPDMADSE